MTHLASSHSSWLELVAETAGVAGAGVVRVELSAPAARGSVRAVVQVVDRHEQVIGATYWYGDGADLRSGTAVDVGCDFSSLHGLRIVAWLDEPQQNRAPRHAVAPVHASSCAYDPFVTMSLELKRPRTVRTAPLRRRAWESSVPEAA
jgi:hypothetical protein